MCVCNEVDQRSCGGHFPILCSFREKCQKVHLYVKYTKNEVNDDSKPTEIRKNIYQIYKLNFYIKTVMLKFEYGIHETFRVIAFSMEERHCILTEKFTFLHFLNKLPVIGKLPLQDHCFTPL